MLVIYLIFNAQYFWQVLSLDEGFSLHKIKSCSQINPFSFHSNCIEIQKKDVKPSCYKYIFDKQVEQYGSIDEECSFEKSHTIGFQLQIQKVEPPYAS